MDLKTKMEILNDLGAVTVGDVIGGEEVLGVELVQENNDATLLVRTDKKIYRLSVVLHSILK